MHVVTFTRSTPDTAANVEVDGDGNVTWGDAATVVNPWDEYALEEAIVQAKNAGGDATVIAIGPEMHNDALKHSIAMGIKNAARVWEDGLDVTDSLTYATLAAAAVQQVGDVNLVLFGKESIDIGTDQQIYQTATKLGWTLLSNVSKILEADYDGGTIKVERTVEQGKQVVTAKLPAVVSVLKGINEPRYPSFIGIRKAGKATIPTWTPADLGAELPEALTQVAAFMNLPPRNIENEIIEGESVAEKAEALAEKLLEEKVL